MNIVWHLVPFPPLLSILPRIKEVGPWDYFPDSLNNWVLNTVLALPMTCTHMGLEDRREVEAIVPQAMMDGCS